jgi:hypothetical protein
MGIENRLRRLEAERGPNLCEERYCMRAITYVEVIHYPDGSEERVGCEPPTLCPECSNASDPKPPHTAYRGRQTLLTTDAERRIC